MNDNNPLSGFAECNETEGFIKLRESVARRVEKSLSVLVEHLLIENPAFLKIAPGLASPGAMRGLHDREIGFVASLAGFGLSVAILAAIDAKIALNDRVHLGGVKLIVSTTVHDAFSGEGEEVRFDQA